MFGISSTELAIILVFGFLLFGPDKLPQMGKTIGRALRQFKETQEKLTAVVQTEVVDPMTAAATEPTKPKKSADGGEAAAQDADTDDDADASAASEPRRSETFAERRARLAAEREAAAAEGAGAAAGGDAAGAAAAEGAEAAGTEATEAATTAAVVAAADDGAGDAASEPTGEPSAQADLVTAAADVEYDSAASAFAGSDDDLPVAADGSVAPTEPESESEPSAEDAEAAKVRRTQDLYARRPHKKPAPSLDVDSDDDLPSAAPAAAPAADVAAPAAEPVADPDSDDDLPSAAPAAADVAAQEGGEL